MTNTPFDAGAFLEHNISTTGISLQEQWKDVVELHLATAKKMADIVEAAPIDNTSFELANALNLAHGSPSQTKE